MDINKTPIVEIKPTGILTSDGTLHEFDVIAIATGFDIVTGGMTAMGLKNTKGVPLQEEWKKSATTYLGTTGMSYTSIFGNLSNNY